MPKLNPWQWIAVIVFLAFYGFAVFALTRDYYLRQAPETAGASPPAEPRTWLQEQLQGPPPDIQAALTETDPQRIGQVADQLFVRGQHAEAVPLYQRILELAPDDVEAHNDLGLALYYSGQTAAALDVLGEGIAKNPKHQRVRLSLGFVRAVIGDEPGAREALEEARALGPNNSIGQEAQRLLDQLEAD